MEIRNSAAHGSLHLGMLAAVFVMWTNQMGDPTFQIFWTSWPKKVDLRHQTLSRSLRRGCGLGTRLDSRQEQMRAIFGSVISVVIAGRPHVVCQLCQQYMYSEWSTCNCKYDQLKWVSFK